MSGAREAGVGQGAGQVSPREAEAGKRGSGAALRQNPRRFGAWRRGLFWCIERLAVGMGGRAFYRNRFLSRARLVQRREVIRVPALCPSLHGLRIAQLSDLHAGPFLGAGDLADVVNEVNRGRPDLVVITGDLIAHDWREALTVLDDLARIEAPHGVLGVFGNHDYRGRNEGRMAQAFAARGIRFLRNESVRIEGEEGDLVIVGLEDLEEARSLDLAGARKELRSTDLEIVLCHNPQGAALLKRDGCLAVLAGHTHGHQIDLPWFRTLGPPHPGLRIEYDSTALIVSRGLGVVGLPLRFGAPAEVVWIELRPEEVPVAR